MKERAQLRSKLTISTRLCFSKYILYIVGIENRARSHSVITRQDSFSSDVNLTSEATWISILLPFQAALGRMRRKAKSPIRKCAELYHLAAKRILAKIASVVPPMLLRLLL